MMKCIAVYFFLIFSREFVYGQAQDCGLTQLNTPSGQLLSPNYPRNYPTNTACTWIITAQPDMVLVITVNDLDIENDQFCRYDYLEIDDGNVQVGGRLCGATTPVPFIASSSTVTIRFVSDIIITGRGFYITWSSLPKCTRGQFMCFDGSCIDESLTCNGVNNCPGGRDEVQCAQPSTINAECGKTNTAPIFSPVSRIVGGSNSVPNTWPWQAALLYPGSGFDIFCGATIINEHFILTAAHCVDGLRSFEFNVLVGTTDLTNARSGQILGVSDIKIHEDYEGVESGNDIAVVETVEPIEFNSESVRPICVSEAVEIKPGTSCFITGWGKLTADPDQTLFSDILQQGRVFIIEQQECNDVYGTIIDSQICAGRPGGGVDACQGDSGGPLVCLVRENTWFQVGIVSYGVSCASPIFPGVYTKVSSFANWINANTSGGNPVVENTSTCGPSVVTSSSGTLTSPGYPDAYGNDVRCVTSILSPTPRGLVINRQKLCIEFVDLFMEQHHGCEHDYLEIYIDGILFNNRRYCGDETPPKIVTTSRNVTIVFQSDHVSTERGFKMHWETKQLEPEIPTCQGEYAEQLAEWRQSFQEYKTSLEEWKVSQRCGGY